MAYYVRALGSRGERWQTLYGTDTLPIVSPQPERAAVNGQTGLLTFEVDLEAMEDGDRAALVQGVASAKGLPLDAVESILSEEGLPVIVDEGELEVWSDGPRARGIEYRAGA